MKCHKISPCFSFWWAYKVTKALETSHVCRNSASDLFRKSHDSNCPASQMARKPMNVTAIIWQIIVFFFFFFCFFFVFFFCFFTFSLFYFLFLFFYVFIFSFFFPFVNLLIWCSLLTQAKYYTMNKNKQTPLKSIIFYLESQYVKKTKQHIISLLHSMQAKPD